VGDSDGDGEAQQWRTCQVFFGTGRIIPLNGVA